ncbi:MAG: DUF393 domain-containing protein [Armatimonadetes bacterium]|nr:DUF393 domain-containing protein [Armatimonadota bacterium]
MKEWVLFYDGGCNLCHVSKLRVESWAEKAGQPFRATPLQSDEGVDRGYGFEAMVLEADKTYKAADAWLKLMDIAPWYLRWVGWLGHIPSVRSLLTWGYGVVAKYRYKWFGTRECKLPTPPPNS